MKSSRPLRRTDKANVVAIDVIQSVWPVLAGAVALALLACFRVLAMFAERQIARHDVVREARRMRLRYMQSRVEKMPTGEWEVVEE